jgi:chromosome segregation ATPase
MKRAEFEREDLEARARKLAKEVEQMRAAVDEKESYINEINGLLENERCRCEQLECELQDLCT